MQLLVAAGNSGILAVTNTVIEQVQYRMLMWVYISGTIIRVDGGSALGSAPAICPQPDKHAKSIIANNGFHLSELPKALQDQTTT